MPKGLSRATILEKLQELGSRLHENGERAELYIVGGAAMALAFARDRVTRDIDVVFIPKSLVYEVAAAIADDDENLGPDWLHDAVTGFLPAVEDTEAQVIFEHPGIRVLMASPRHLLAMKVLAARVDRDPDDMITLCHEAGAHTITNVLDMTHELYGDLLTAKSKLPTIELLQDVLPLE